MAEKICLSCSTENPSHFEYCKHCGAPLPTVDKIVKEEYTPVEEPDFGELSYKEYKKFIGKNADSILHDFNTLNTTRFVFCIPVLLLGLFFGFFVARS